MGRLDVARALAAINLYEPAYARLDEAYALVGEDASLRARALAVEIEAASRAGDFARASRAVEKLEAQGPLQSSRVLLAAASVRAASGDVASSLRLIAEAERLDAPDDLAAAVDREKQRVLTYISARDCKAAVEASEHAVDLARTAGVRASLIVTLHNLGDAARRLGDLPRAYAALTESKELSDAAGQERLATLNRIHLAYLDGMRGVDGAEAQLRDAVRYVDSRGFVTDALEGRFLLGMLHLQNGQVADARRELAQVLAQAVEKGNRLVADDAREALATAEAPAKA